MFNLLKKRGITFLSFSNTVSQLGDRLTHMVIVTLIGIMSPGRISAFSEFSVAFTLPIIILAPFAGVFIDHYNKQTIMLRCHIIQALLIFITPTMVMLTRSIIPIWVLVVLFFALDLFNNTSRNALVPDLVDKDELVQANSLIISLARIATFAGMLGGGYLVHWVGWQFGFYIDASTHFIAGLLVLGMGSRLLFEPVRKFEFSLTSELKKSFWRFLQDLKELGLLLVKDRVVVFVMLSVFILPFVAAVSYTVLIFLVQQEFGMGTKGVGLLGAIIGIGMLIGGVLMGVLGKRYNRGKMIIAGMAVLALLFLIGPFCISIYFLYVISIVSGMVFSVIGISQDTILQEDVLKEIRGRIFATKEFAINVTFVLCAILIGVISNTMTSYTIIFSIGIFLCFVTALGLFIYFSIPAETRTRL
jgi:DHA3 family macrolide efflux protein-like MFS transporter